VILLETKEIRLRDCDPNFVNEVIEAGGKNAQLCFSCGTCSGGCPAVYTMDYTPRQIMRMVELGIKDRLFKANTIWVCAGCHTCTTRCPRGVEISKVMAALKSIALKRGYTLKEPAGPAWYNSFLEVINSYGRVFEPELMLKYNLKKTKNPIEILRALLKDAPMGVEMFRKGKLILKPDRIRQKEHLKIINENIRKMRAEG
jgi:heterodisulfide reductase subunit C